MIKVMFKVEQNAFEENLAVEMSQVVRYAGEVMPFFKYVLHANGGHIFSYTDWSLNDGFYSCEVGFSATMVLSKIKQLTKTNHILQQVKVDLFMMTRTKVGYSQVEDGFTEAGFWILNEDMYYSKLVSDIDKIKDKQDKIKISLTESEKIGDHMGFLKEDIPERIKRVYSFFVNRSTFNKTKLVNALGTVKDSYMS